MLEVDDERIVRASRHDEAETARLVGAAAGRLATSAAVGAGRHRVAEAMHDTEESDTDRLAREIAMQFTTQNAANAWLPLAPAS